MRIGSIDAATKIVLYLFLTISCPRRYRTQSHLQLPASANASAAASVPPAAIARTIASTSSCVAPPRKQRTPMRAVSCLRAALRPARTDPRSSSTGDAHASTPRAAAVAGEASAGPRALELAENALRRLHADAGWHVYGDDFADFGGPRRPLASVAALTAPTSLHAPSPSPTRHLSVRGRSIARLAALTIASGCLPRLRRPGLSSRLALQRASRRSTGRRIVSHISLLREAFPQLLIRHALSELPGVILFCVESAVTGDRTVSTTATMVASVGAASDPCAIRAALPVVTSHDFPLARAGQIDRDEGRLGIVRPLGRRRKGETSSSFEGIERRGALIVETTCYRPPSLAPWRSLPALSSPQRARIACDDRFDLVFRSFDPRRDNSCAPVLSRAATGARLARNGR